jgi:hypothetical protein
MFRAIGITIIGVLAAVAVAGGCGGSAPSLTRAEFTHEANVACARGVLKRNIALEAAYKKEANKYYGEKVDPAIEQKILTTVFLPEMRSLASELGEIGYPGDDGEAEEFVNTFEEANDTIEEKPDGILLPTTKTPLTEVDKLAEEYGLDKCVQI